MKKIPLYYKNKIIDYALVDDEDFNWLNQYKWLFDRRKNTSYAKCCINTKLIYMHRMIYFNDNGTICDSPDIDHEDRNGLNNQKKNLRIATDSQNGANRGKDKGIYSSKYKGVCFISKTNKWQADIRLNDKSIYIGRFTNEIDAAIAYDIKSKELYGDFAGLNFKDSKQIDYKLYAKISSLINDNKIIGDCSSKYIGVYKCSRDNKFAAQYSKRYNGIKKTITIGRFDSEKDAALARDFYVIHLDPTISSNKLNFPNPFNETEEYIRIKEIILSQKRNKELPFKSNY